MRHQSQASCMNHVPRELPHHELQEEALIKVSVMYPNKPGVRFDHEYYRTKHLPLIKSRMGAALKYYTVDKGLADREGRPLSPYVAMCHLLCDSVEEYQSSFGPHARKSGKTCPISLTGRRSIRSARWWSRTPQRSRLRRRSGARSIEARRHTGSGQLRRS